MKMAQKALTTVDTDISVPAGTPQTGWTLQVWTALAGIFHHGCDHVQQE